MTIRENPDTEYLKEVSIIIPKFIPGTSAKPSKLNYYRINITWENGHIYGPLTCKAFLVQYFNELCLEQVEDPDGFLSYLYEGTDEGLKMLKRSVSAACDIIYPKCNVTVLGKQIKK
jgi:hypothetical protein